MQMQSLFHFFELLLSQDKDKHMRIKANNDLGHLSRSRISNMETESQKETEVSANKDKNECLLSALCELIKSILSKIVLRKLIFS